MAKIIKTPLLRTRIVLSFALLMILGGVFTTILVTSTLIEAMRESLMKRGQLKVRELSSQSSSHVLSEDIVALKKIIDGIVRDDEDVVYVFLLDAKGRAVVHSFPGAFPMALADANMPSNTKTVTAQTLETEEGVIYDFAFPVLEGKLGTARIGLSTRNYEQTVTEVKERIILTTGLVMFIGIVGLVMLAINITNPLRNLTMAAERISEGDLLHEIDVTGEDEIGKLAQAFKTMVQRLRQQIEDLRSSERQIKHLHEYNAKLLDSMGDCISVIDSQYRIEFINDLGKNNYGEVVGKNCREAFGSGERPCEACPMSEVVKKGEPRIMSHTTGGDRILEISMFPVKDAHGKVAVIERTSDITDQVRMQRRLDRSEQLAFVGEIAASVAHEINNPLDGIQNCLEIIRKDEGEISNKEQFYDLIAEGLDRIAFIVKRLLVFSKKYELDKTQIKIADVIRKSLIFISSKLERDGIVVELEVDDSLPTIEGDSYNLSQVIMNIVLNSAQAIDGQGRIAIRAQEDNKVGGIRVDISDNGCGISPDDIDKIFDPFFTTKDGTEGTGLGLSFSKKIIEQHGGELSVRSVVGRGATFSILLPPGEEGLKR